MLLFIVTIIIFLILADPADLGECLVSVVFGAFISLVLTIAVSLIVIGIFNPVKSETYTKTYNIYNLTDTMETHGEIMKQGYYARGYIENELVYYYMEETEKGFIINHHDADKSYIVYSDEITPSVTYAYTDYLIKEPFNSNLFIWTKAFCDIQSNVKSDFITLIIPTGSIAYSDYEINLE